MIVLVDTREKKNGHILKRLKELNIGYVLKKLDFGDYSFTIDDKSYEHIVAIERKASLTELAGNFAGGKKRFHHEFKRASSHKCKMILMVEDASLEQIREHSYRSSLPPSAFLSRLKTWQYSHQLQVEFVEKSNACDEMLKIFVKYFKKKRGEGE